MPGSLHRDLRVVAENFHPQGQRRVGDFDAHGAKSHDAERAAGQFKTDELLLALLDGLIDRVIIAAQRA